MSPADEGSDLVVLIVIGAGVLLFSLISVTIRLVSSWKGGWRIIALLPVLALAGLAAYMFMRSGSAGLWPIVIVFWGLVAMVGLAAIAGVHALIERLVSRAKNPDDSDKPDVG